MLEKIIKKWWFYAICIVLFFVPPIVQQAVSSEKTSLIVQEVMQRPSGICLKRFGFYKGLDNLGNAGRDPVHGFQFFRM